MSNSDPWWSYVVALAVSVWLAHMIVSGLVG